MYFNSKYNLHSQQRTVFGSYIKVSTDLSLLQPLALWPGKLELTGEESSLMTRVEKADHRSDRGTGHILTSSQSSSWSSAQAVGDGRWEEHIKTTGPTVSDGPPWLQSSLTHRELTHLDMHRKLKTLLACCEIEATQSSPDSVCSPEPRVLFN